MRYHHLAVAAVVGTLACGGAEQASYSDAVTADPSHYSTEFENDAVRVLRVDYGPGEQSVMHRHPFHCAVGLSDESWRMQDSTGAATEMSTPMGDLTCVDAGVHQMENLGSESAKVILFEMKDGQPDSWSSTVPDAATADPAHYSVAWENDAVRVVRVNYGAGESSVLHHHPAYCFVAINDGMWQMTDSAGVATELPTTHGQFACVPAEVHQPQNMAAEAGQAVLIEFKGRETVE